MEFKKQYKFIDFLFFIIMMGVILVMYIALIICAIVLPANGKIIGVVCLGICAVVSLVVMLLLCRWVTIDEEKIEIKILFQGIFLSFNINDIYKVEKKPGAKGTIVCIVHANTPQNKPRKIKTINLLIDEKREKILRHFITNPDVWVNEQVNCQTKRNN